MTEEEKDILAQWVQKASHDLIAAKILIDASPVTLDIACFHCQQSIEKYLKTFLIFHNHEFEYTHNLDYLANECAEFDNDFKGLDMKNMNVYAVEQDILMIMSLPNYPRQMSINKLPYQ